mmetsp:Transcript_20547/g.35065  ORF Transcript_20547/g.35065 Transcript_20547/m.35065 type:complete len:207 (+) Transcript_20547:31-651(+)
MKSLICFLFVAIFICVVYAQDSNGIPANVEIPYDNLPYCFNITGVNYEVCYGFFGDVIAFSNTLIYSKAVWMGIGYHAAGSTYSGMNQADFSVAEFDATTHLINTVSDRFCNCTSETEPPLDTEQGGEDNILEFGGSQTQLSDGTWKTRVYFARYRDTGDSLDHQLATDPNQAQPFIWAHGTSNPFGYHQSNKGEFTMNLLDPYNY